MPGLIQINGPSSTAPKDGKQHSIRNGVVIEVTRLADVVLGMSGPRASFSGVTDDPAPVLRDHPHRHRRFPRLIGRSS